LRLFDISSATAVNREVRLGIVEGPLILRAARPDGSGTQDGEHAGIAAIERKLGNPLILDDFTGIRLAKIEQGVARDRDRLRDVANYQCKVDG
jgi:hypothetical protein